MVVELAREVNGATTVSWDGVEIELARAVAPAVDPRRGARARRGRRGRRACSRIPRSRREIALEQGVPPADVARVLLEGVPEGEARRPRRTPAESPPTSRRAGWRWHAGIVERYERGAALPMSAASRAGHLGYLVFEATAEAKLVQPTFLTEFPLAVSPLARKNDTDRCVLRSLRAVRQRQGDRERVLRAQRPRRSALALPGPAAREGRRRRRDDGLRRGLLPRARGRHAADGRRGHRHRSPRDAARPASRRSAT